VDWRRRTSAGGGPSILRELREVAAQRREVQSLEAGMSASTKQGEEILVVEMADTRDLQFQQSGLPRVGIDRMDASGCLQGIVQGVAAGAGDDQESVIAGQLERTTREKGPPTRYCSSERE
jgi:hypothetical protein